MSAMKLLVLLACFALGAESARVLMLAPLGGKSQKNLFYGLGSALASRGHEVVFFNAFKPSSPVKGIREVVPDKLAKVFADENFPNVMKMNKEGMHSVGFQQFRFFFVDGPKVAIESKELEELLKEHFDVVVFGMFSHPLYFVPHVLKAPYVFLTPLSHSPLQTSPVGNPTLPALHPLPIMAGTERMSFLARVQNVLVHFVGFALAQGVFPRFCDGLIAEKFGEGVMPSVADVEKNVSLVLLSSNFATDYHTPLLPNTIPVGGMHCEAPRPLPKELVSFLGDSEFVYFSLGSVVRPQDMSPADRAAVLGALGSLPFKVLLKWDTTDRAGVPDNILPSRWLPQQDILGHPRCRLFISHGGFASVLESLCHGVPTLMIPVSGDHQHNAARAAQLGVAEVLAWDALTEQTLRAGVAAALSDAHLAAARHRRRLLETQPVSPRQLAVHWVEHVIEHGGAPHLRSVAADLNWAQYYSLDVMAFLLAVLGLLLALLLAVLRCCCRCLCRRGAVDSVADRSKARGKRAKRD